MLIFRNLALSSALLLASSVAHSAIQRVDFTLAGPGSETAAGFVTYDEVVVAADNNIVGGGGLCNTTSTNDNSIDYELRFTGGAADGVVFRKSDCSATLAFCDAPDFNRDINFFQCSSGNFTADGTDPNRLRVTSNGNAVTYNVTGSSLPTPAQLGIPTLPLFGLGILVSLLGLFGLRKLRQ
ncbi:MAG: IPTL-CTERM sorting domain-containing protein [Luminiphilus sp.]|nr:IPTL-CTERM sorting domain-containing protein [Luminiphilus sp.]